jgi:CBS domain-containing protein
VLGRLPRSTIERSAGEIAGDVMEPGPSTVRADLTAAELLERLRSRDLRFAIVTTPEGRLIGIARRDDLEQLVS